MLFRSFVETLIRRGVLTFPAGTVQGARNAWANADLQPAAQQSTDARNAHEGAVHIAEALGLWQTNAADQAPIRECIADVMFNNISGLNTDGNAARNRFETASTFQSRVIATKTPVNSAEHYASLRVHAMNLMVQGISGSWDSAQSRKVGRALNASAPQDDLHCLFGHFC